MKYFPLVWSGLWRKRLRTILTMLSVIVAFVLYGILHGVTAGFDDAIERLTDDARLITQNGTNVAARLPLAHLPIIESVPGVRRVALFNYFGAYYQEPTNFVAATAVDIRRLADVAPEFIVAEEHVEAMEATRTAAIIGPALAERFGWSIGDRVTLQSPIWPRRDGSRDWTFDIVGIYQLVEGAFPNDGQFWINYDYFDEARAFANGTVSQYGVQIDDAEQAARIAEDIDRRFANSPDETITRSQRDFIRAQIDRVGNISFIVNSIISAVLFTLLFLTGNTMMQSMRERLPEFAVLKTYGYSGARVAALVLAEALLLCGVAALIGLAIAAASFPTVYDALGIAPLPLEPRVIVLGLPLAVALAVASASPPLWRAHRLDVADVLAAR